MCEGHRDQVVTLAEVKSTTVVRIPWRTLESYMWGASSRLYLGGGSCIKTGRERTGGSFSTIKAATFYDNYIVSF